MIDFSTKGRWSQSTKTCYRTNWTDFERFCEAQDAQPLPATAETVAAYLRAREATHSTSAISQRLAAIRAVHKDAKGQLAKTDPERDLYTLDDPVISDAWKEILRRKGNRKTPKAAVRSVELKQILPKLSSGRLGARNRAMLLLGLAGAMRRSEIVALNRDDLEFSEKGMLIHIRRSKTDQEGKGTVVAARRSGTDTCPVTAMETWLSDGLIDAGPVFIDPRTRKRLGPPMVAYVLKKAGGKAGYDTRSLGAHSLRRGCITEINDAGVDLKTGMEHSRHKTPAIYLGYVQSQTAMKNPAIKAINL